MVDGLSISGRGCVIGNGRVVMHGDTRDLLRDEKVRTTSHGAVTRARNRGAVRAMPSNKRPSMTPDFHTALDVGVLIASVILVLPGDERLLR